MREKFVKYFVCNNVHNILADQFADRRKKRKLSVHNMLFLKDMLSMICVFRKNVCNFTFDLYFMKKCCKTGLERVSDEEN
jgi:hypothetical protein